jgi:hypothetical protein
MAFRRDPVRAGLVAQGCDGAWSSVRFDEWCRTAGVAVGRLDGCLSRRHRPASCPGRPAALPLECSRGVGPRTPRRQKASAFNGETAGQRQNVLRDGSEPP